MWGAGIACSLFFSLIFIDIDRLREYNILCVKSVYGVLYEIFVMERRPYYDMQYTDEQ